MNQQEATHKNFLEGVMEAASDRDSKAVLHEIYNQAETAKIPIKTLVKPFAQVVVEEYSKTSLGDATTAIFGENVPTSLTHHVPARSSKGAAKESAAADDEDDDDAKKAKKHAHPHKK